MYKLFTHFFTAALFLTLLASNANGQCSLNGNYSSLFEIEVFDSEEMEKKILLTRVAKVNDSLCYAQAVNTMPSFFNYLKNNYSDHSLYTEIDLNADSATIQKAFETQLNKDAKLTGRLNEYFAKAHGRSKKDEVLYEEILDIAVKFFSIQAINDKGYYEGKVCVGINLLESTAPKPKPFLEAFAFSAIMYDIQNLQPNLMDEFKNQMKVLYDLNLGLNEEERLLRAQGAMFMLMKNNTRLNAMLATHYAQNINWLPFTILQMK